MVFPPQRPLARLTLPLKSFVHRLDRLIAGYLMELAATHYVPEQCHRNIAASAKILTVRVATYLAELISSLLRPVIYHANMILFDSDTEPLLPSKFWVRPVYQELLPPPDSIFPRWLNSSARFLTWSKWLDIPRCVIKWLPASMPYKLPFRSGLGRSILGL